MRACRLDDQTLSAYSDGELSPAATAQVAEHVGACAECERHLGRLQRLAQLAQAVLRAPGVDAAAWEQRHGSFRAALRQSSPDPVVPRRAVWRRRLAAAAVVLLGALASVWWLAGNDGAAVELAYREAPGANAARVLELACDAEAGYSAQVHYPATDAQPLLIVLSRF